MRYILAFFLALTVAVLQKAEVASAGSLAGSWSGSGKAYPTSGKVEPVRCRISYEKSTGRTFLIHVNCSHSNGMFKVSGRLVQLSESHYSGSLYSEQHDVSGKVSVRVNGNRQTLNANSPKGRATVILMKQ